MKLWAKKTGRVESDDLSGIEYVHWGNVMESVILQQYSTDRYAGRQVAPSGELMRSIEHPVLLATLDARTEHEERGWIPLDAKNTGAHMEERWADGPPLPYLWQIRHQALVEGTRTSSIAVAVGGNKLFWADDELQDSDALKILRTAEKFWWYVENDIPPEEIDGSEETKRALDATFSPVDGTEVKLGTEFLELDLEYADLKSTLSFRAAEDRVAKTRCSEIENTLKRAIGNHGGALLQNGTVWKLKYTERKSYTVSPKPTNKLKRVVQK